MSTIEYNKVEPVRAEPSEGLINTLGDLRSWIAGLATISESEKAQMRSAIRRADDLIGHGSLDLAADPQRILSKLDQLSPALAGVNKQAFANLKSRVRKAFKLATPVLKPARSNVRLTGEWLRLQEMLDIRNQRRLSRFLRFACGQAWQPQEISDAHIERFRSYLRDEASIVCWEAVVRQTVRAWNRIRENLDDTALPRLTAATPKRVPYWIAEGQLPPGLRRELDAFLTEKAAPNVFGGGVARAAKPATVRQTVQILEKYLADWRGKLCKKPTPWLFANAEGEPMNGNALLEDLSRKTHRELGVRITPHQYRHLSVELYLQENPEGLAVASFHLGHRDQNTTRKFYARSQQRQATRRYHEHLIEKREGAKQTARRCRRSCSPPRNVEKVIR
jgi:integrase